MRLFSKPTEAAHTTLVYIMGVGSIIAAVSAFGCALLGMLLAGVPIAGSVLSFASPLVALSGLITGGVAWSKGRSAGVAHGPAIVGCVLSAMVFLPSLVIALTCGLCNACYSAALLDPDARGRFTKDFHYQFGDPVDSESALGDTQAAPPSPPPAFPEPDAPLDEPGNDLDSPGERAE